MGQFGLFLINYFEVTCGFAAFKISSMHRIPVPVEETHQWQLGNNLLPLTPLSKKLFLQVSVVWKAYFLQCLSSLL